jgi:hypothetical protein
VTVGFDYAVFADGVSIVETRSGGFVQKVEAMDEAGNFTEVWSGVDSLTAPGELELSWPKTIFTVHGLRVTIDADRPGNQGIDSIQLLGSHPLHPVSTSDPGIALTVVPVNDAPKMPNLYNVRIKAGLTGIQTFNVTDAESPVEDLRFEFTSANESLVPVSGISVDASGTTPKLIFNGTADALGASVVTVTATDPQGLSSTIEFTVIVLPRSNYPVLTSPETVATDEDVPISFTISVEDERATSEQLEVWAKRLSGPILSSIPVTGAGPTRTVTVTPQNRVSGTARIQIYVRNPLTDQGISGYVDINISMVNDLPIIEVVDDRHAAIQSAVVLHQTPDLPLQIHEEDGSPLLVTITADHGTLTAPSASHIAIIEGTGTGDSVMKMWGTEQSVNAFLDDLTFTPDAGFEGTAGVGIVAAERTLDDRIGQWADQVTGPVLLQAVVGPANRGYTNLAAQLAPVEITATFANPAFAEAISVFERIDVAWNAESPNDSKVRKVELQDTGGSWHTVWDGPTKYVGRDEFVEDFLSFPRTTYIVQAARVTFHDPDDSYSAQLDAIFLHSSLDIDITTDASTSATIPIVVSNALHGISLSTPGLAEAADNSTTSFELSMLVAADPDSTSHSFTLVSGSGDDDNAAFEVQGDRLLVKSGVVLDFETKPDFTVRIQADDGTQSFEKALTIAVVDVAETITLSMVVPEVMEGGLAQSLTVTRNTSVSAAETVTLWTGHADSVQIPVLVTIPAGQWSADVDISAIDNFRVQGDFVATIAATRIDAPQTWLPVTIIDDDLPGVAVGNLSVLSGTNGFRIDGIAPNDFAGWSVDTAGDLNGDGYTDVLVGA